MPLGAHSSLATAGTKPATCGAIKLPIIIHQVLGVLSTFRSSAWHFPLIAALANSPTEFRQLHQAPQLSHYVLMKANHWSRWVGIKWCFGPVVRNIQQGMWQTRPCGSQFTHFWGKILIRTHSSGVKTVWDYCLSLGESRDDDGWFWWSFCLNQWSTEKESSDSTSTNRPQPSPSGSDFSNMKTSFYDIRNAQKITLLVTIN